MSTVVNMGKQQREKTSPRRPTQQMGDALRAAREERGLSMQAAGAEAGISAGYLFKLERGYIGSPSPRVLQRLAPALGIEYRELMALADYELSDERPSGPPSPGRMPAPGPPHREPPAARSEGELLRRMVSILEEIRDELRHQRRDRG